MIYHVTTENEWNAFLQKHEYAPAAFRHENFIHCCQDTQLKGVLQRYFGRQKDLMLLHINENKLIPELKYESSTADELFPHVYGPINKSAIVKVEAIVSAEF